MMTVNLSPNIESRYRVLAIELGLKEDELLQEAIISYLEDLEDVRDAEYRLDNPESYLTLDEWEKSFDLED
ncbi:MAG: CopG family transcriptional regulator [Cyanobacteria bacterium]|uniref:CopG family transcriptional regulator n=1 Tax=Geminocystis sp. TaxID=2664100 RepID=UPI001D929355|nr:CopG family transcriptional regulator [Cyanobacteria bacterium CG_2015-16_32_12]NCO77370.1 CopG family transcriptional regulator [Cyanobacteria bacterium CG_2015-22_32_23]NCQ03631.1 CopG family transcriptional regulator [Cyanobacteria bacterium CG_2015-09_32_10]NCQ40867.1 CopG family transcriptional regulator [Cyanobacteria bacterium CG_2015-04_32_10]NCS84829.1 CopG family transcriptional regulator [Cyanobacteria bacterium CG_2015-02_32_10]